MKTSKTLRPAARPDRRGFSLAELMVVIVILGLLATIVVPNVFGYLFKANTTVAKIDINAICDAVDNFMIQNGGVAPDNLEILVTPDEDGNSYLKELPLDPWKSPYMYEPPVGNQPYRISSYGADGAPGGEGKDADIDNFTIRKRQ